MVKSLYIRKLKPKSTQAFALGAPVTDSGDPKSDPDYARPAVDMGLIGIVAILSGRNCHP